MTPRRIDSPDQPTPYADAAPAIQEGDLGSPLPIPFGQKSWPPAGYTGADRAIPDDEKVQGWVDTKGGENVALAVQRNVVGVDVDAHDGKLGMDTLIELEKLHGRLPPTWSVTSRTNGSRLAFYRLPEGVTSDGWANQYGPGIDVIRYGHRYAMVAPSVHPSGEAYRWLGPDGTDAPAGVIPECDDLAELPMPWVELVAPDIGDITPLGEGSDVAGGDTWTADMGGRATPQVTPDTILERYKEHIGGSQGSRHDLMNEDVLAMVRMQEVGWAGTVGNLELMERLFAEMADATKREGGARLARLEFTRSVDGAKAKVMATPTRNNGSQAAPTNANGNVAGAQRAGERDIQNAVDAVRANVLSWAELWAYDGSQQIWAIERIAPAGRLVALYAEGKVGKSLLMLDAAAAMATGKSVLGFPAVDPVHVVYLDYEMTMDDVQERLLTLGYDENDDMSRLHYYLLPELPPLDTPKGGEVLRRIVAADEAETVVVDTLIRSVDGGEQESDTYKDAANYTWKPLKRDGITVIRLDHAGKDVKRGQRGSSAKRDDVDVLWLMTEPKKDELRLRLDASRVPWVKDRVEITREENPLLRHVVKGSNTVEQKVVDVINDLETLGVPVDVTNREAGKRLRDGGKRATGSYLAEAVRWRKLNRDESKRRRNAVLEGSETSDRNESKRDDGGIPKPSEDNDISVETSDRNADVTDSRPNRNEGAPYEMGAPVVGDGEVDETGPARAACESCGEAQVALTQHGRVCQSCGAREVAT
jgi:hypothetical protein